MNLRFEKKPEASGVKLGSDPRVDLILNLTFYLKLFNLWIKKKQKTIIYNL